MFLLSQTIKEEILPKPLKYRYRLYLIGTGKYQKNDWYRGMQLYSYCSRK